MKLLLILLFALFAQSCAKSSSSTSPKNITVYTYHDLPKCNSDFQQIRAVVQSENKTYICLENQWQDDYL